MNRLPALSLLVSAAVVALAPAAEAKPRVHTDVTVRNATPWKLRGAKLTAKRANGHKLTVKLKTLAAHKRRTIHVAGHPHGWRLRTDLPTACTAHRHRRVTCVVNSYATGALPLPPSAFQPGERGPIPPAPAAKPAGIFAPYVDMTAAPDLPAIAADSGAKHISLGFVNEDWAGGCHPKWAGLGALPASGPGTYRRDNVAAFQQAGGEAIVSFGGASGIELATSCATVDDLAAAYQGVIDAYGLTRIDFDIEGPALANAGASANRDKAIVKLQQNAAAAGRTLTVGFTLPSALTGLDATGLKTVSDAIGLGVKLSYVNLMTMDFGPAGDMGAFSTGAGDALMKQLAPLYPSLTAAQVAQMVGVTPMIGINDQPVEIFGLADAATVQAWASQNHIGMLGMWSLGRDEQCPALFPVAQPNCSGVAQNKYAFAKALGAFTG
jgi:hypothetical protein